MSNRAVDVHKRLNRSMYHEAKAEGLTLSAYLEAQDPTPADDYSGVDAFGRQLREANIRTRSVPGYAASRLEAFDKNEQTRALLPEFLWRQWRGARAILESSDGAPGSLLTPYQNAAQVRTDKQLAPAIPLEAVISGSETVTGESFRALYVKDSVQNQRSRRVAETAEVPATNVVTAENNTRLYKYGRRLLVSYESLRRVSVQRVAVLIARMGIQTEIDKVATVIDVMVNGDGNTGANGSVNTTPVVVNLSTLDASAAGKMTLAAWIALRMRFPQPYSLTTALGQTGPIQQLYTINTGSANIPLVTIAAASNIPFITSINGLGDSTAVGWTTDAPANKLVLFDKRYAVQEVIEANSQIEEIERWTTTQVQSLTMTENVGFNLNDPNAVLLVDLSA